MNRRSFLKTLGALAVAAHLPPLVAKEWEQTGRILGETFYLDEPLILNLPKRFLIRDCHFVANPGFIGNTLVEIITDAEADPDAFGLVDQCSFDGTHMPKVSKEVWEKGFEDVRRRRRESAALRWDSETGRYRCDSI